MSDVGCIDVADVYKFLHEAFREIFGREIPLSPGLSAKDVMGWDSFKQVEISLALEEKYSIRIRAKELNLAENLGEIVQLVMRKVQPAQ